MNFSIHDLLCELATLGPIGRNLPAPGTAGSAIAIIIGYILIPVSWPLFLILTIGISIIGIIAANYYSKVTKTHDSGKIIIDEVAGQWIALLFIPYDIKYFFAAFVLFRLLDITKIWPVNWAERLNGGVGIVTDDLVAGLMSGVILLCLNNWWELKLG